MRAGRLRRQVDIRSVTRTTDTQGGNTEAWQTFATVWADIEVWKGHEQFEASAIVAHLLLKLTIRYLAGVMPQMRVYYGSRVFEIIAVEDAAERHREMSLICEERSA